MLIGARSRALRALEKLLRDLTIVTPTQEDLHSRRVVRKLSLSQGTEFSSIACAPGAASERIGSFAKHQTFCRLFLGLSIQDYS